MLRRVHVPDLQVGQIDLPDQEAHHLRSVLRAQPNDTIELFDDQGRVARATITGISPTCVTVRVGQITEPPHSPAVTIASALPKGERADWMIEKLSELGVARFIPLQTARSTVHPEGHNKFARWRRIATESAKQSHRPGVMQIDPLTTLVSCIRAAVPPCLYLSPLSDAPPLSSIRHPPSAILDLTLVIGPEGGWTPEEVQSFREANISPARLTNTILRVETAAIVAAALVMSFNCKSQL